MKRNELVNKHVVKAISVGLSAMMAMSPMVSLAAEAGEPAVAPSTPVVPEAPVGTEKVSEALPGAVGAQQALGNAINKEETARAEAVLTIGAGIITDETQAALKEAEAKRALAVAEGVIKVGDAIVDAQLDKVDANGNKVAAAEEAAQEAAGQAADAEENSAEALANAQAAAGSVAEAAQTAAAAADHAINHGDSASAMGDARVADAAVAAAKAAKAEADKAAALAGEEAQKAAEAANEAEGQATTALAASQAAEAEYQAAVAAAKAAEALADALVDVSAEDAAKATEEAKAAWDKAAAIKIDAEEKKAAADQAVVDAQNELDTARDELVDATAALQQAIVEEGVTAGEVVTTGILLQAANEAVNTAQGWVNDIDNKIADKENDIENLQNQIDDMKSKKSELESSLAQAKADLAGLKQDKKDTEKDVASLEKAISAAESALDTLNNQLADAETVLNNAITAQGNKQGEVTNKEKELVDGEGNRTYKGQIYDIEEAIAGIQANEELSDEEKTAQIQTQQDTLVGIVISNAFETEVKEYTVEEAKEHLDVVVDEKIGNKIYQAGDKLYTYEVAEDGSIQVYDLERTENSETYKVINTEQSQKDLSAEDLAGKVVGLEQGVDYDVEVREIPAVEAEEAEYTVSYKVTTIEEKNNLVDRNNVSSTFANAVQAGYTVYVNGKEVASIGKTVNFILGTWDDDGNYGYNHSFYRTTDGKWYFFQDSDKIVAKKEVATEVKDQVVTESQLAALKADTKNSELVGDTTPTKAAVEGYDAYTVYDLTMYATTTEAIAAEDAEKLVDENGNYVAEDGSYRIVRTKDAVPEVKEVKEVQAEEAKYTVYYVETIPEHVEQKAIDSVSWEDILAGRVEFEGKKVTIGWNGKYGYYEGLKFKTLGNGQSVDVTILETKNRNAVAYNVKESELKNYNLREDKAPVCTKEEVKYVAPVQGQEAQPAEYVKITVNTETDTTINYAYADETADASETKGYYATLEALKGELAELEAAKEGAQKAYDEKQGEVEAKAGELETKRGECADAKEEVARLTGEIAEKEKEISKLNEDIAQKNGDIRSLERQKASAEWDLNKPFTGLKAQKVAAEVALGLAEGAQKEALKAHEEALENLAAATIDLVIAAVNEGEAILNVAGKEISLEAAKGAQAVAQYRLDYATELDAKAKEAYDAAYAAQLAVEALKGSADVSSAELKAAEEKVKELKDLYEKAQAAADQAREDADKALQNYQDALKAVANLAELVSAAEGNAAAAWDAVYTKRAREEALRLELASRRPVYEGVIAEESLDVLAQSVADQAVLGARQSREAREAALGNVILGARQSGNAIAAMLGLDSEEEVAEAGVVVEDDVVTIEDEETALAPTMSPEERAKMSWWWLLIIAVCGATGYTWYRNHQKKVEADDLEA